MDDRPDTEMLVDFVRGQLDPVQAARITQTARDDPALAADIEALRAIRDAAREPGDVAWSAQLGWARLSREIRRDQFARADGRGWKVACMVLGLVCLGQLGLSLSRPAGPADAAYDLAEAAPDRPMIRAIFRAEATEGAIRSLIRDAEGEIIAGPSAQGLYDIGFADIARRDAALASFADAHEVVDYVEAAGPR